MAVHARLKNEFTEDKKVPLSHELAQLKSADETDAENTIVIWSWDVLNKIKQFIFCEIMKISFIYKTGFFCFQSHLFSTEDIYCARLYYGKWPKNSDNQKWLNYA